MRYSSSKDERACTLVAAPPRAQGVPVIVRRESWSNRERTSHLTLKWKSRKISSYSGTSNYLGSLEDRRSNSTDEGSLLKKGLSTNGSSNLLCFNWRCTRQILSVPLPPSSVYTHRRIDPWTIKCRWRATPSERCVALPAEGWYDRVCPLERWKYINRGWWLFFRSTDWSLPTVKIFVWNLQTFLSPSVRRICVYVDIYVIHSTSIHPAFILAERTIRCFPLTGRNHLWQSPANRLCRSISVPTSREKFGNRPTRGTRRQGNRT